MKYELVFQDSKSHKFWTIEVSADSHSVSYGRVGSPGQSKTKTFDSAEACAKDAEKLIAAKRKKGYVDLLQSETSVSGAPVTDPTVEITEGDLMRLDVNALFKNYDWGDITDGHRDCPQLLAQLQEADAQGIAHVIGVTLEAFSFVSGGGWTPSWMQALGGDRREGSGLLFLGEALALLREKDEALWVSLATQALPYVVCEGEAIDHDEGEGWDTYIALSEALAPFYEKATEAFAIDQTLASLAQQLRAIATAHVRGDPLLTSLALLKSAIPERDKERILDLLLRFLDADLNMINWAISCDGLDVPTCARYAELIQRSSLGTTTQAQIIAQVLRMAGEQSEYKIGRATGASSTDFYWPAIHTEDNARCPIFHFDGEQVRDLGTLTLVAKVMCWTPEGLYFGIKQHIYRYDPKHAAWEHVYDAGFQVAALAYLHGSLCAVGGQARLCRLNENKWQSIDLDSDEKFSGLAAGAQGAVWVTGTQGTIRLVSADGGVQHVDAIDKEKKNYRPLTTDKGVYVYCTSGLYRIDLKKPKKILKDKVRDAVAIAGTLHVATAEALLRIEKDKIVHSLPITAQLLGVVGESLAACVENKLLVLAESGVRLILPTAPASAVRELPV